MSRIRSLSFSILTARRCSFERGGRAGGRRIWGFRPRWILATSAGTSLPQEGSDILVATGRIPNTQTKWLEITGVSPGCQWMTFG